MLGIQFEFDSDHEKYIDLVVEAVSKFPTYYPIHFIVVRRYLPQWGGTPESLEATINYLASAAGPEGDIVYARSYWFARNEYFRENLFFASEANWDRMRAGLDQIVASFPTNWNLNNRARFALLGVPDERLVRDETLEAIARAVRLESIWFVAASTLTPPLRCPGHGACRSDGAAASRRRSPSTGH